jgi:hypothetical protein
VNTLIEDFSVAVTSVDFEASGLYNSLPPYLFEIYKFYGVALDGLPYIFVEPPRSVHRNLQNGLNML